MKIRKTLLFYVVLVICIIGIPAGINWATGSGIDEIAGILVLVFVFASVVVFALEQVVVTSFRLNKWGVLLLDGAIITGSVAIIASIVS